MIGRGRCGVRSDRRLGRDGHILSYRGNLSRVGDPGRGGNRRPIHGPDRRGSRRPESGRDNRGTAEMGQRGVGYVWSILPGGYSQHDSQRQETDQGQGKQGLLDGTDHIHLPEQHSIHQHEVSLRA